MCTDGGGSHTGAFGRNANNTENADLLREKEEKENLLCIYVREGVLEAEGKKAGQGELLLIREWKEALTLKNICEHTGKIGICRICV